MKLSNLLFREKTQAGIKDTVTFNAPGTYYPPYGKTAFLLQGKGQSGNAPVPGNYAGTNPSSQVYWYTNSPTQGNQANQNPPVPASTTTPVPGFIYLFVYSYDWHLSYDSNYSYYTFPPGNISGYCPPNTYIDTGSEFVYTKYYCLASWQPPYTYTYNYTTPGNWNYNTIPGTDVYYTQPGNAYYNPTTPGNAGSDYTVLGITLPGGAADTSAPVVGYSPVSIDYSPSGTPISCPPGGYVKIQNV